MFREPGDNGLAVKSVPVICRQWLSVWLCAVLLMACMPLHAQLEPTLLSNLAALPQWKRLLHLNRQGVSEVNSPEFFLAENGRTDPQEELRATVAALTQTWSGDPNEHPRCRFPARYLWLSQQMQLPSYQRRDGRCSRVEQWARLDDLQSISIYFVSGYFGNPASTFGHALVKFNSQDGQRTHGLLDMSVGFGALVPDNELAAVYVYKGLLGGYQAGFSDKPHYHNDVMYGHTEFRDMWDYELNLSAFEREMFVLHVAEIAGKKFDYFFLNKNCATRIGELIEAATGRPIVHAARAWYMPIELFQSMEDLHASGPALLARPPRFIPSAERNMLHAFGQLRQQEVQAARAIASTPAEPPANQLGGLSTEEKIRVLNSVLAYHEYGLIKQGDAPANEKVKAKNAILSERLSLPISSAQPDRPPAMASPSTGHAPMLMSFGLGHTQSQGAALQLRWAMSSYEFNGFHGIEHGELMVLDTTLSLNRQQVRLDRLDLIRVRKLNPPVAAIDDTWPWSWQVRLGSKRIQAYGEAVQRIAFEFGAGWAAQWQGMAAFAMLGGVVRNQMGTFAVDPQVGLSGGSAGFRWSAEVGRRKGLSTHAASNTHMHLNLSWRLTRDQAVRLHLERDTGYRGGLDMQTHW